MHNVNPVTRSRAATGALSTGSGWDVLTNWTVQATFYSDNNCSVANGQTKNFTMSQFMDLYYEDEGCENMYGSINYAFRCIDGKLGYAYYRNSDSTCSLDPVSVYKYEYYSCRLSYIDYESYIGADCTGNLDTSDWSDDDDWDGNNNLFGTSLNHNNGDDSNNGSSYMRCRNSFCFFCQPVCVTLLRPRHETCVVYRGNKTHACRLLIHCTTWEVRREQFNQLFKTIDALSV